MAPSNVQVPPVSSTSKSTTISPKPIIIPASSIARVQTVLSILAFLSALVIGSSLHYKKIVKNGVASYPQEWLPSVSATIGDWFPERNIFQILIALTAVPRFTILFLTYHLNQSTGLFLVGALRTLFCGGWVYITSSDHSLSHDALMIGYIVLNIPWMVGNIKMSRGPAVRRKRLVAAAAFFTSIAPLVYFYIQHKVHRVPGAYSYYAIFEWALIFFDVFFDSVSEKELRDAGTQITLGGSNSAARLTLSEGADKDTVIESSEQVVEKSSDQAMKGALETALAPPSSASTATTFEGKKRCSHGRAGLSFLSDLYLSYVYWSTFTALIPSLFYFSVWELGVSGQELTLLSLLSPLFLTMSPLFLPVPSIAVILSSRSGQAVAYIAQFSALLAYLSDSPLVRLAIVTFSCIIMMQREVILVSGLVEGEGKKAGKGVGYWGTIATVGFVVSSLSKHANHGNNPIWPFIDPKNGGYNEAGLALAVLALIEFASRRTSTPDQPEQKDEAQHKYTKTSPSSFSTFLTTSVPLGSLVFSLHNLLSDPSSLVAASWTGWENGVPRGPFPHIYGGVTLVVCCVGGIMGVAGLARSANGKRRNPFLSAPWFVVGCAGTYGMYALRNWEGYGSSLVLAFVLLSSAPAIFAQAGLTARGGDEEDDREPRVLAQQYSGQVAKTFSGAMLIYIVLNLASIFTAAYAFVPGGWIFRERTDAVLTAQMICLSFAYDWPALSSSSTTSKPSVAPPVRRRAGGTLAVIAVTSLLTTIYRLPMVPIKPHQPGSRLVNAGIWTVHFGINNVGHDSQRGMRNLIKDMHLDIVGLLETDLHRTAFGHRDLTRVMVEELGYNVDIGPGPNSHTWGAVLLTKYPIINTTHHLLPSPGGELAPAIEAVLDIYGTLVTVVVSHNGQEEDPLDRELQSTELARIMRSSPYPVIFLGYVVTKPHQLRPNPYQIMVEDGNVHDIDDTDTDRWCEYIFYRGLYRTAYARVSRGIITDTEMQIGQFVVPPEGTATINDDKDARYIRVTKEEMSPAHWFPQEYHGNRKKGGKNGHFYHVHKTPKYFKQPEDAVVQSTESKL